MIPAAIPAMTIETIKRTKDGKCLLHGFFTLKWAIWAQTIRNAINIDDINIRDGNQIPATNKIDREIFEAPTKLRIKFDKPYCLNSITMLSNLKTHT